PMTRDPTRRGQFGGRAACGVVPGKLQDRGLFPGDGVLPYFADLYRRAIRRGGRGGVLRHADLLCCFVNYSLGVVFGKTKEAFLGFISKFGLNMRRRRLRLFDGFRSYAAMPNSSAMKVACAIAFSFATHLALPFRIIIHGFDSLQCPPGG